MNIKSNGYETNGYKTELNGRNKIKADLDNM